MKRIERIKEHGGWLERYRHPSSSCQCEMTFSVYLPPQAATTAVPVVYWLSGLTCSDDNFRTKAGAQRYAAELGLILVIPDTSPRGADVADEPERYDLGQGAGFYVDATAAPWQPHYQMYSYIQSELPQLAEQAFPIQPDARAISGHSMGGHGALMLALRNPGFYRSASAFAPICNPTQCGWGEGCFSAYLGENQSDWADYDSTLLLQNGAEALPMLIDQGTDDEFLADQLFPQNLKNACETRGIPVDLRMQDGYDHSYHFISTFIGEHLAFHAKHLKA